MTALELIQNLNLLDEHERIEAKRASEAGKSVLETICAFANEPGLGGGWIVLGVAREELALFPVYEVEGVVHPDKITTDIATQCRNMFNIPWRVDIATENVQGKNAVVVFAPEAQPQDKPVFSSPVACHGALFAVSAVPTNTAPKTIWRCSTKDAGRKASMPGSWPMPLSRIFRPTRLLITENFAPRRTRMPRNCAGRIRNSCRRSAALAVINEASGNPPSPA